MLRALLVAGVFAAQTAPVYTGCSHVPHVRPASIVFACADANFYATALKWTRWTAGDAAAAGTAHVNDCDPYCAAGHFHTYRVAVQLAKPVVCVKGRTEFSRVAWRFLAAKPKGPRSGAETLPCRFLRLRP